MPMLLRMKLAQRLALSYGAVIVLLISMALVSIVKFGQLREYTSDALKVRYPAAQQTNDIMNQLNIIARAMRNTLILTEADDLGIQAGDIERARERMSSLLSGLHQSVTDSESRDILKEIDVVHSAYIVNQDDFTHLVADHRMGEAKNLLLVDLHPYQNQYFSLLEKLNRRQEELMTNAGIAVDQSYAAARQLVYWVAIIAALLGIFVTTTISRSLLRQLGGEPDYAAGVARKIAVGDLKSEIQVSAGDHSSLLYVLSSMRDGLVQRTEALQAANNELATTVETLKRAQDELVSSEKLAALGALVAGISHELNTPIGNSMMAASTLTDLTQTFEKEAELGLKRHDLQQYLGDVQEAGKILLRNLQRAADLVSSFKQVAIDRETSQRRKFQLKEVVDEILLTLQPRFKKTGFKIEADIPGSIIMNSYPGPFGQVLTNLINNAVIHGFDGRNSGHITVAARQVQDGKVELAVQDNGVGIRSDHLKRIYDPFFTTKLGSGGSGLGLHITYNIVTGMLGGKIRVTSEQGIGTTFVLTLPLSPADQRAGQAQPA